MASSVVTVPARSAVWRYGPAVLASVALAALRHLSLDTLGATSAACLYPAVVVSSWLGGATTGLLATALCTAALVWDRPPPPDTAALPEQLFFLANGVLISGFCQRLRRTRDLFAAVACRQQELQSRNARLYQQAQQANHAKDDFIAVLSHELRTPLNAIVGWTHMLRGGRLAPEMNGRALEIIERNSKVASQLLADMLDISRIVAGKLRIERAPVDLQALVQTTVDSYRWVAEEKGVRLVGPLPGPAAYVNADPERLQQVVGNLLGNAIKFTPAGGQATIGVVREDGEVRVSVEDNGVGIRADLLPHVFERYRQGDSGLSRHHRGLGLGLAIARHVIEMHDGIIEASSDGENRGARFVVRLPCLKPPTAETWTVGASSGGGEVRPS
jgi:signal transduction histidine kinase